MIRFAVAGVVRSSLFVRRWLPPKLSWFKTKGSRVVLPNMQPHESTAPLFSITSWVRFADCNLLMFILGGVAPMVLLEGAVIRFAKFVCMGDMDSGTVGSFGKTDVDHVGFV